MRDKKGKFMKGNQESKGRKKGSRNNNHDLIREIKLQLDENPKDSAKIAGNLLSIAKDKDNKLFYSAVKLLLSYLHGQPRQTVITSEEEIRKQLQENPLYMHIINDTGCMI